MRSIWISGVGITLLSACSSAEPGFGETGTATVVTTSGSPATTSGGGTAETTPTTGNPTSDPSSASESTIGTETGFVSTGMVEDTTTTGGTTVATTLEGSGTDPGTTGVMTGTGESTGGTTSDPALDTDLDGVPDGDDNCDEQVNEDQQDTDNDGIGDVCDDDDDDDGKPDPDDNCPLVANPDQKDTDGDKIGDACDDDLDNDSVPNDADNCPLVANKDQADLDKDTIGDVCDDDKDGDSIPDGDDVFPNDPGQPGVVIPKKIYAQSSGSLYTVDVVDYSVVTIGPFKWPQDGGGHQMTDIAIDRYGVLYGVTFDRAYVCNPASAQCFNLGTLPGSFNGLTWIPAGTLDPDKDSLIGITNAGAWNHLKIMNGQVLSQQLGTYGAGYTSAGDAFSIEGVGTFAAVNKQGINSTVIVTVDPLNGKVLSELATTNGFNSIFGLAGWEGLIIAFNSNGAMIKVDPITKMVTNLGNKPPQWWGAGVGTVLPQ